MPPQIRVPRAAKGGKPVDVRRHNLGTLLGHLHESGPLSRADLTARMGLNRSTIGGLVVQLTELSLVREERPAGTHSGAGRPSLVVSACPSGAQVLAADIGVDRVVVGLVGLGGRVVTRRYRRITSSRSPSAVAALIRRLVDSVLSDPAAGSRIVGMGVALPGVVRHVDGFVRFAPNLGWVDQPLGDLLATHVGASLGGLRARVGNDADLGVLAEHLHGVAVGHDDVVFLAGEVGVGGGCIVGGRPLLGAGGYAGELGHLPLVPDGRACRCGARGCWETEIGAVAIARALGLEKASSDELVLAVRAAAAEATGALDGVARFLGRGLAGVVNLLNPRLIIIAGLLGEVFTVAEDVVRASMYEAALAAPAEQVQLTVPLLGDDAVLVGASELAWEDLLADPVGTLADHHGGSAAPTGTPGAGRASTIGTAGLAELEGGGRMSVPLATM
jgi:predicted NBD/HSP70 family sugar kinase